MQRFSVHRFASRLALVAVGFYSIHANAGLFEDEEARRAILEMRPRIEQIQKESDQRLAEETKRAVEESAQLRRSLLDLQNQLEQVKSELAKLRGQDEQIARDLSDVQRRQKDLIQGFEDRFRKLEPQRVVVDGREFLAEPNEKRDFEGALSVFRKGDFAGSQGLWVDFLNRYGQTGYRPSALFWLGNAQYATKDYKEAIANFRLLVSAAADHLRAPEAVLAIANCQLELKDTKTARKTLEELVATYPNSEAAVAGRDRLSRIK